MALTLEVYADAKTVCEAAANYICHVAQQAVQEKGYFTLALAGGRTPNLLYQRLAEAPYSIEMPWQQSFIFWGDERYVLPTQPDSNYGAAWEQLFSKINIPADNIYPMPTTLANSEEAATLYEQTIHCVFTTLRTTELDLVLLGMGDDGHTASLFPGSKAVSEYERWVVSTQNPNGQQRLTLTVPILNKTKQILFLVTGEEKKSMLHTILTDHQQGKMRYPAAMVSGRQKTVWMVDTAATNK